MAAKQKKNKPQTLLSLRSNNVKRLKAIRIKPDGSLILIGGKNDQGKSCCLDSIEYLFGGKAAICKQPLRQGTKYGKIVGETQDYIVTRTFTKGHTELILKSKKDGPLKSPQTLVDAMYGDLTFDPLKFTRLSSREQVAVLKTIAGADFDELDRKRSELYDERAYRNRELKQNQALLETLHEHYIPQGTMTAEELLKKLDEGEAQNRAFSDEREKLAIMEQQGKDLSLERKNLLEEIVLLKGRVDAKEKELARLFEQVKAQRAAVGNLEDIDLSETRTQLESVEQVSAMRAENERWNLVANEVENLEEKSEDLTRQIKDIDEEKEQILANSSLPIEGLSLDEDGVFFEGIPFDQCASSKQLRVSTAMGMAMNPDLRVLLIRDGSLLDEENMQILSDMADEQGFQIWVEVVEETDRCQVIIEDGEVKE